MEAGRSGLGVHWAKMNMLGVGGVGPRGGVRCTGMKWKSIGNW